jgi:5-oxopent-3-ene-1,2,5-tricarboxylate decarboxylase/2-hydroxyhepta-2,4-diene-1,7-dioate isomerase
MRHACVAFDGAIHDAVNDRDALLLDDGRRVGINDYRPNLRAKSRDRCTPIGPWLVDAADIADPMALDLSTTMNGTLVQHGNTRDMVFDIPALIACPSSFMTLSAGDVILTGTPEGSVDVRPGGEVV